MNIPDENPTEELTSANSGTLTQIRLGASFLTILPVRTELASETQIAASMGWFPLIGLAMGIAFALEDYALSFFFDHSVRSTLIVLSMAVLSGAVHLDGLADTADALGAGSDRVSALAILRDSRIGVFGAIALFFALGLKTLSLVELDGWPRFEALILAPMLSRWALLGVSYKMDYLRTEGSGSKMLGRESERNLTIATVIAIGAMLPFFSWKVIFTYAIALMVTLAMRSFYLRWLGGITGDLIGACSEIVEVLAILTIAA